MTGPETPPDSPLTLEDVMSSPAHRRLMTPELAPGDPAFPFDLPLLDADFPGARRGIRGSGSRVARRSLKAAARGRKTSREPSGKRVRLADFAGERPVALIFGSYT